MTNCWMVEFYTTRGFAKYYVEAEDRASAVLKSMIKMQEEGLENISTYGEQVQQLRFDDAAFGASEATEAARRRLAAKGRWPR